MPYIEKSPDLDLIPFCNFLISNPSLQPIIIFYPSSGSRGGSHLQSLISCPHLQYVIFCPYLKSPTSFPASI